MDLETGKWIRVGKVPGDKFGDEPEITVTGLEPGHEFKFRVRAVNDEGDSEPLTTEKAIIAKNPFGKLGFIFRQSSMLYLFKKKKFVIFFQSSEVCTQSIVNGPGRIHTEQIMRVIVSILSLCEFRLLINNNLWGDVTVVVWCVLWT